MQQNVAVIQAGSLKPLCDLLVVNETKVVMVILDALLNVLQVSSEQDWNRCKFRERLASALMLLDFCVTPT